VGQQQQLTYRDPAGGRSNTTSSTSSSCSAHLSCLVAPVISLTQQPLAQLLQLSYVVCSSNLPHQLVRGDAPLPRPCCRATARLAGDWTVTVGHLLIQSSASAAAARSRLQILICSSSQQQQQQECLPDADRSALPAALQPFPLCSSKDGGDRAGRAG